MANPGQAPERAPAPGVTEYLRLQNAGFSAQELNDWRAVKTQEFTAAGFTPKEVAEYWGTDVKATPSITNYAKRNVDRYAGRGEVADDAWEQIQAGFGMTAVGLGIAGHKPDYILPKDASLGAKIMAGVGQMVGDAPPAIVGFLAAAPAGAGPGAAVGAAVTAPAGGTGAVPGAAIGSLVTGGAAASALPVALREGLLAAYDRGEINTREEALTRLADASLATLKAGAVGAAAAPLGGAVGGKVLGATGSRAAATTADLTSQAVGATAMAGALEGQMPDHTDFAAAVTLALVTHGATRVGGRAKLTEGGQYAHNNAKTIYRQTGVHPTAAAEVARTDPVYKQEFMQQDVNGEPVIPKFRREAPPEIEPFRPKATAETPTGTFNAPSVIAKLAPGPVTRAQASAFLVSLEGSANAAKVQKVDISQVRSPAGAIGEYQIMPGTAAQYGFDPAKLTDRAYNKRVHDAIVADLHRRYNGDMEAIATAYNAGPGRANKLVTQGPGTRLETVDGKVYTKVSAERNEAFLPMETQKYLANLRRRGGGGKPPPPPPEGAAPASGEGGLPALRRPTEVGEPNVETVYAERLDWAAKSAEERYAAAREMVGDEERGSFLDLMNPDLVIDQVVSELRPARMLDNAIFREHPDMNRDRVLGVEDMFRNTYASDDRTALFVQDGAVDGRTNLFIPNSPSLKQAFKAAKKAGGNARNFEEFMLALRTVEKEAQGIKTGMDPELARAIVNDPKEFKKYAEAVKIFQQVGHGVLDYAVAKGRYSREQADRIIAKNLAWISMRRVQGDDEAFTPGSLRNFKVGKGIREMEGSDKKVISPTIASIDNWRMIIADADRNEAAGTIVSIAERGLIPEGWDIKHVGVLGEGELSKGRDLTPYTVENVAEVTEAFMPDIAQQVFKANGKANQFLFFRDGKAEIWETSSPELARLLRGAESAGEANVIIAGMQAVAGLKRAGITSMPDFALKTTLSDQVGAWITDPYHPPPFITLALGVIPAVMRGKVYKDWAASGGAGAGATAMDRDYVSRDIREVFDRTGFTDRVWNLAKHPVELAQLVQERIDAAQRIGHRVYVMKVHGVESRKAGMLGRKTYVDFKEKATLQLVNTWAKITPFLRPTLLGTKNIAEAVALRPLDTALHLGIFATVATGLAILNYNEDPDLPENRKFQNMARWKKDMYLTLPEIYGHRYKLATRDATMLMNMTVNRAMDFWRGNDKHAFDSFASDFFKTLLPGITPTFAQPINEATFNYSEFSGRPLIPAALEDASGPMQYTDNTTETAKALARWLGNGEGKPVFEVSPIVIDNYIRGYLGTGGIAISRILNAPDEDTVKPKELADNPFVAGFVHRTEGAGAEPIQKFYDAYAEVKTAKRDLALAKDRRDMDEFREARSNVLASVNAEQVAATLKKQQSHLRAINANEDMDADEKRQYSERIYSRMIVVAKRGLEVIDRRKEMQKARDEREAAPVQNPAPTVQSAPAVAPSPVANAGRMPLS